MMSGPDTPDRELVELCLQGNQDAWVEFLRRFHRLVAGVGAKTLPVRLRSQEVIEDLVQETWKRICNNDCRALRELEWLHEGALRGILKITASSAAKDHVRIVKSQKRDIDKEEPLELVFDLPTPDDLEGRIHNRVFLEKLARCIEDKIQSETHRTRDIAMFLLFFSHRVTASDLARVYELGLKAVENTVARLARIARQHCL
jgi:RNA polymerase sigma-70 factor (ECF subfamily)